MNELTKEDIERLLSKLTTREVQVICSLFKIPLPKGVEPIDPKAARERVRQIEAKALRKLVNAKKRGE